MKTRTLGKTGFEVSEVSFGAWAIGADWGEVSEADALRTLHRAVDKGVTFFDTADVYGDGRSERLLARLRRERSDPFIVATKAGRRLNPHTAAGYTAQNLRAFVERSLTNLEAEALELLQLHCPPTDVYYRPEVFGALEDLKREGLIQHYGVSVERVEEALKALEYPGVATVQIVFNLFRQRPAEKFFREAEAKNVGILARVPLASGLLTGKLTHESHFAPDDHRHYNRHGEAFDRGETFSGVDFETGLGAVDKLRALVPEGMSLSQFALRWILMFGAVSCAIPGGKTPQQVADNTAAADFPDLSEATMRAVNDVYDSDIAPLVHQRW